MSHARSFGSLKFCCPFSGLFIFGYVFVRKPKNNLTLPSWNKYVSNESHTYWYLQSSLKYCWWFRNPAKQLRLVASLSTIIYRALYIPGGKNRRISEPSTCLVGAKFWLIPHDQGPRCHPMTPNKGGNERPAKVPHCMIQETSIFFLA